MRSVLVLIFVVEAALICAAQFEEKIDYSTIKLRKVAPAQVAAGGDKVAIDNVADPDDNKSRVAQVWGVKLRRVQRKPVAVPVPEPQPASILRKAILSQSVASRSHAEPDHIKAVPVEIVSPVEVENPIEPVIPVELVLAESQDEPKPAPQPKSESALTPVTTIKPAESSEVSVDHDEDDEASDASDEPIVVEKLVDPKEDE